VVSPEAVMQLDVLPSVALAERANLLVMQIGLRIQGSGLTHSGAGIAIECLKIKEGMFDALVAKHFLFHKHKAQILDALPPAPVGGSGTQGNAIWDKYFKLKTIFINETLPAFSVFFDMETFAMKQSGMSFDDAKPM